MSILTSHRQVLLIVFLAVAGLAALLLLPQRVHERIEVHGAFVPGEITDLADRADALAFVQVTGRPDERWNSADNRKWGTPGEDAFIYRDVPVRVLGLLAGRLPATFTIRDLGGTADGTEFVFDGSKSWEIGTEYLVFLEHRDFPTREGSDANWTPVRLGQGVFEHSGGDWYEGIQGIRTSGDELSTLADRIGK